jgi:hypothetical protein
MVLLCLLSCSLPPSISCDLVVTLLCEYAIVLYAAPVFWPLSVLFGTTRMFGTCSTLFLCVQETVCVCRPATAPHRHLGSICGYTCGKEMIENSNLHQYQHT